MRARAAWRAGAAACALALCAAPVRATGERERGVRLAREGRCQAALADLAAARAEAPADAELARLEGLCQLRLRSYGEAVRALEAAAAGLPGDASLQLELAKARFHHGDLAGAEQALDAAAPSQESDAEYQLYRGMLRFERGDLEGATAALERARELDAARVEPVASYYLGLALARSDQSQRAGEALRRVSDRFAGTGWGSEAARALARIEGQPERLAFGSLGAGLEYDSNVVLRGAGVPLPEDISDDADWRGVWTASAGAELWKRGETTLGLLGSYRGTTHADLQDFDAHFPGATLWLDGALAERLRGRLRYDFGYAWLDAEPFVATHGPQASLERDWQRLGASELYARIYADEYFFDSDDVADGAGAPGSACVDPTAPCGPPGLDESDERSRDGFGWTAGLSHRLPLATGPQPLRDAQLSAGFRYAGFDAGGREYSFDAYDFHAGFGVTLPAELAVDVAAGFTLRPYRHASTFPDPDDLVDGVEYGLSDLRRREKTSRVEVGLSRSLGRGLSLAAHYRYLDNASNVDVFDYDQHVVGVSLTLALTKEL
jgi:tetratricopeptide (TPR) repeat protein